MHVVPIQKWPGSTVTNAAFKAHVAILTASSSYNSPSLGTLTHIWTHSPGMCVYFLLLGCDLHWNNNLFFLCVYVCMCVYLQFPPTCENALSYLYTLWSNNAINHVLNTVCFVLIPTVLMAEKCITNYLDHPLYYQWLCVGLQKHAKNSFFIQSSMKSLHIYIHDGIKVYILWVSIWHTTRF